MLSEQYDRAFIRTSTSKTLYHWYISFGKSRLPMPDVLENLHKDTQNTGSSGVFLKKGGENMIIRS